MFHRRPFLYRTQGTSTGAQKLDDELTTYPGLLAGIHLAHVRAALAVQQKGD